MEDKESNNSNSLSDNEQVNKTATVFSEERIRLEVELMAWEDGQFHQGYVIIGSLIAMRSAKSYRKNF